MPPTLTTPPPVKCGGLDSGESGTIESPNYPANYPNLVDCSWIITTNLGRSIHISSQHPSTIEDDKLTCSFDSLTVSALLLVATYLLI